MYAYMWIVKVKNNGGGFNAFFPNSKTPILCAVFMPLLVPLSNRFQAVCFVCTIYIYMYIYNLCMNRCKY